MKEFDPDLVDTYDYDDFYLEPDEFLESLKHYGDVHYLKTVEPHFTDIYCGWKGCEVRFNDRDYKVDDVLYLQIYDKKTNTIGKDFVIAHVNHILNDSNYCKEGFVIMSITIIDSYMWLPF